MCRPLAASLTSPGEQKEIAVGIAHNERSRAPGFRPERLKKLYARRLIFEKERLGILQSNRHREQLLGVAPQRIDDSVVDVAKVQSSVAPKHLAVKRRLAPA